jgi:hypothetical protein
MRLWALFGFGRSVHEIPQHGNPDGGGAGHAARLHSINRGAELMHADLFTPGDFIERGPGERIRAEAGAMKRQADVALMSARKSRTAVIARFQFCERFCITRP